MPTKSYGLFCPLAMACEIVEPRWTLLILSEMLWGSATRFNEIRRGVPGISPTLLAKRLRELEARGLVERVEDKAKGTVDYLPTTMAVELDQALLILGEWAYRNLEAKVALQDLNPDYLMWNLRRKIDPSALPKRRVVVRFHFKDLKEETSCYWLILKPGADPDLCMDDPGFDVDLYVEAESEALASVFMEYSSLRSEISRNRVSLIGDARLAKTLDRWLIKSGWRVPAEEQRAERSA